MNRLTGPNKGQIRNLYTVHASDTLGKKVLPSIWMAALWGWLISGSGHGDQTQEQLEHEQRHAANQFIDNVQPGGGHSQVAK